MCSTKPIMIPKFGDKQIDYWVTLEGLTKLTIFERIAIHGCLDELLTRAGAITNQDSI